MYAAVLRTLGRRRDFGGVSVSWLKLTAAIADVKCVGKVAPTSTEKIRVG